MGYRAKFIINTAKRVQAYGGQQWLEYLEELGRLDMVFSDGDSSTSRYSNSDINTAEGKGHTATSKNAPSPSSSSAAICTTNSIHIKQGYKHQPFPSSIPLPHQDSITTTDNNTDIATPSVTGTGTSDVHARPGCPSDASIEAKPYSGVPGDGGSRAYIQSQLMLLPGVGPKVCYVYISAYICILLMAYAYNLRLYRLLTAYHSSR